MAEVVVSEAAGTDLDAIFDYTVEHWGVAQAVMYLGQIDATFASFSETPYLGTMRPDVGIGIRSLSIGSHIAYFTSAKGKVAILRVLHGRMSPNMHL